MKIPLMPSIEISTVQIHGIVERVRSEILKWALDLESRGVLGEGLTFTQEEKQTVQALHYHIENVSDSQILIGSSGSTQTQTSTSSIDLEALKEMIRAMGKELDHSQGAEVEELRAELATLKAQAESPKPKLEIIKATARSIKSVAEGAAGSILAGLAQQHVATLLALAT